MTTMQQTSAEQRQIRPVQFLTYGELEQIPVPLIRITTCGLLTVEMAEEIVSLDPPLVRYMSLTPEQLQGRGTVPAFTLLKLLLSRYERFADHEWLLEQFCDEGELLSSKRINNLASQLRNLLCSSAFPALQALRMQIVAHVRGSGSGGYQLAAHPLVWVDQDALAWHVEQATRMERFNDTTLALPFWERAYEIARRGPYLPDEIYADWSRRQRGEVEGALRQSVQALARLYQEQQGTAGEEEALRLLRSYWLEHSHEEDVLRILMELLGKRECTHEALKYYEQLCAILKEDEREPDSQTQDVAAYLRNKQITRQITTSVSPAKIDAARSTKEEVSSIPHIEENLLDIHTLEAGILAMKESRRSLLQQMLGIAGSIIIHPHVLFQMTASETITLASEKPPFIDTITLSRLEKVTRDYWHLFRDASSKSEIFYSLSGHLQTLLQVLHHPQAGIIRNRLYALACEAALMIGEILFDMQDYQHAPAYYRFAIATAKEAGDNALRAIGLGRLSFLPIYTGKAEHALPLLLEAQHLLSNMPRPTISAWLSLVEAEALAHVGDGSACEKALATATLLIEEEKSEESRLWTHINDASLPAYQGACYLQLRKTQPALDILERSLFHLTDHAHRHRSIILTDMAATLLQDREVEKACQLLQQALELTIQTKSLLVITRMHRVRNTLEAWRDVPSVQLLDEAIGELSPYIFL